MHSRLKLADSGGHTRTHSYIHREQTYLHFIIQSLNIYSASKRVTVTLFCFQLQIAAADQGVPVRRAVTPATVTISVTRSLSDPIFFQQSYTQTITQDVPIGTTVIIVTASDADTAVGFL